MESCIEITEKSAPFVHFTEKRKCALSLEYAKANPSANGSRIPLPRDTRFREAESKWSTSFHLSEWLESNKLLLNRLLFCSFAVLLLWLTTYKVATTLARGSIPSPLFASVHDTCYYSYDQVLQQRTEYEQCATQQLHTCHSQYHLLLAKEQNRSAAALMNHSHVVDKLRISVKELQIQHSLAQELLTAWSLHDTIPYTDICSDNELQRTKQIIGDLSSVSSVMVSTDAYISNIRATLHQFQQYTVATEAYHNEYLLNHTEALRKLIKSHIGAVSVSHLPQITAEFSDVNRIVDTLLACVFPSSLYPTSYTCPQLPLHEIYATNIVYANAYVLRSTATFSDIRAEVKRHVTQLTALLKKINTFYDSVMQMSNWVVNKMPTSELKNMAELCSKSSPSWCDFNKVDWFIDTLYIPDLPLSYNMPNVSAFFGEIRPVILSLQSNLSIPRAKIDIASVNLVSALEGKVVAADLRPKDYHPPQYADFTKNKSIEDTISDHDSASKNYVNNMTVGFDSIIQTLSNKTSITKSPSLSPLFNFSLPLPIFSSHEFSLLSMSGEHVNVVSWFLQFNSVQELFILLDIIFRLLQTVRLVRKYYRKGHVTLPIVNTLKQRSDFVDALSETFSLSTNIGVFFVALLLGIILVIYALSVSYIPLLQSYKNTCVHHTQNATFITHNLHATAYNYAQGSGSRLIINSLKGYNYEYNRDCTTLFGSSSTENENYKNELKHLQQDIKEYENDFQLLTRCIDVSGLDNNLRDACCGHVGYDSCEEQYQIQKECPLNVHTGEPYNVASHYLTTEVKSNITLSDGSVFNCEALPRCEITCSGPNEAMLQRSTHECGCVAEWGIHAAILKTLLVVVIFGVMNASRYLICKGLLMVGWRSVMKGRFQLVTNCDEFGALLLEDDDVCDDTKKVKDGIVFLNIAHEINSSDAFASSRSAHSCFSEINIDEVYAVPISSRQEKIRDRVQNTIRLFEIKGVVYIIVGAIINVIWIVLLEMLGANLAYSSE